MTAYYVGDIPAEAIVVEPARNGEAIDLSQFDTATADLRSPAGAQVLTAGFSAAIIETQVLIEWPSDTVLTEVGIYTLTLTLESTVEGWKERVAMLRLVVEEEDGWHTLESARDEWIQAPSHDLQLHALLANARRQVIEYAPVLTEGAAVPLNYRSAQLAQARNIWNAGAVSPSGELGEDSFVIRPHPLDWMIKQLLRPRTAIPVIG